MSSPYCSKCGGLEATRPGDDMGCECRESDGRKCKGCEKPLPDFEYCMECHGVERESEGVVVEAHDNLPGMGSGPDCISFFAVEGSLGSVRNGRRYRLTRIEGEE